jgi:hypothetical protein
VVLAVLAFGIEEVAVGSELEDEVEDVENEEDDGGSSGEGENALHLLIGIRLALIEDGVKLQHELATIYRRVGPKLEPTAAGITSEAEDKVIIEQVVWAVADAKVCSVPLPLCPR